MGKMLRKISRNAQFGASPRTARSNPSRRRAIARSRQKTHEEKRLAKKRREAREWDAANPGRARLSGLFFHHIHDESKHLFADEKRKAKRMLDKLERRRKRGLFDRRGSK